MQKQRTAWIDIAKGISIILVVLHHTITRDPTEPIYSAMVIEVNDALVLFRMPLFFFTAGLFIGKLLERPFAERLAGRLTLLLYVYVLWSIIMWIVRGVVPVVFLGSEEGLWWIAAIAWQPHAMLWFIYALAIFTTITWLTRTLPKMLIAGLGLAAAVAFASGGDVYHLPFYERLARFFPWFYLGHILASHAFRAADRVRPWHLASVPVWFAACYLLLGKSSDIDLVLMLPFSATGIVMGMIIAVNLGRTPLAAPLSYVGRNTLPIYVAHFIPLVVMRKIAPETPLLLQVAIATVGPLILYVSSERLRLRWLFAPPAVRRGRPPERSAAAASAD